jgi:predicted RND superfamily exporter protein
MYLVSRFILDSWKLISCLIVAGSVFAFVGLLKLSFDVSPNDVFLSDNRASQQLQQLYRDFGHEDNEIVIVLEGDSLFEPDGLEQLRLYRDQLLELPKITSVSSIFDLRDRRSGLLVVPRYLHSDFEVAKLKRQITQHPIGKNQLVSHDGSMLVMVARVAGQSLPLSALSAAVADVKKVSQTYEATTGGKPLLAGHLVIRAETLESLRVSMVNGSLFATLVSAFVSLILFRGIWPVLICCAAPALGVLWTLGVMGWTGQQIGALGTVIPTLVMVIGLSDAVHLLLETRRHLAVGKTRDQAMMLMLCRTGPACLLTSLTTVIGFGSLLASQTQSVQQFGLCAALGSSFALLADLLVLPVLIRYVSPRKLVGRSITNSNVTQDCGEFSISAWTAWIAHFSLKHAKLIAAFGIAIAIGLIVPAFRQEPDIIWTETLPKNSDATLALQRADEVMGGALRGHIIVQWPEDREVSDVETLRVAGEVHQAVLQTQGFSGPFSVVNVLETIPIKNLDSRYRQARRLAGEQLMRLVNEDRRRLVVSAQVPNHGAAVLEAQLKILETRLLEIEGRHPGYSIHVSGTVVAAARNMRSFIGDLGLSLAVASVIIFVVLTFAFRSLRLGLISIVPNALPLLVTAAGLVLCGYPLQITSALTFSLCLGLAVDDTIHVMMRYRQLVEAERDPSSERRDLSVSAHDADDGWAIRETISQVGPALAITTAILVSGFGAMLISPMPGIQMFSLLGCIILVTAFVGDLLILPAMLFVFARKRS